MFSHPGKELYEHLGNVQKIGLMIFDSLHREDTGSENTRRILETSLLLHDSGKATCYFQEYIQNLGNDKWKSGYSQRLKSHSEVSAIYTYIQLYKEMQDLKAASLGYFIVLKHHSDLCNFERSEIFPVKSPGKMEETVLGAQIEGMNFEYVNDHCGTRVSRNDFYDQIEEFNSFGFLKEFKKMKEKLSIDDYFNLNLIFSILVSSDKGDAIYYNSGENMDNLIKTKFGRVRLPPGLVDRFKEKNIKSGTTENKLNKIREEIYSEVESNISSSRGERLFSINAPTGSGKTLTVFNAALKLRNRLNKNHRIIYTLPHLDN
jgi:CRISPR-associated endonuclease/helicase Cas3